VDKKTAGRKRGYRKNRVHRKAATGCFGIDSTLRQARHGSDFKAELEYLSQ
jgi:hypothetical protein